MQESSDALEKKGPITLDEISKNIKYEKEMEAASRCI